MNNYFINSFIDNGINNYLLLTDNKEYSKEHIFEIYIIKALCKIYGEINIINPYRIHNELSFKSNLLMYGLSERELELLFYYFEQYDKWLNLENAKKTDLTIKIEKILVNMVLMKSKKTDVDKDTIKFFDDFFDPVGNYLAKLHSLITIDNDVVPNYWRRKKLILNSKIELVSIRTDLLAKDDYASYGINIEDVEKMPHEQVLVLNDKIEEKEKKNKNNLFRPKKIIISSGSGFVDTIMLLSIMATEIMIGLILAFYFLRG